MPRKSGKTQVTNTEMKKKAITIDLMNIKRMINKHYEQLHTHKYDNLHETDQLFERHNLAKHTQRNT